MQTAATDAFDFTKENKVTRNAYGDTETGRRMLTARRLVERGSGLCRCGTTAGIITLPSKKT